MARKRRRRRLKLLLDDGTTMQPGCALRIDGDRLLIDAGVHLDRDARLTLFPLPDDPRVALLDMEARVELCHEDVLVSADAEYRFLAVLDLTLDDAQRRALGELVDQGDIQLTRFRRPVMRTHDDDLLSTAIGLR